MPYDATFWEAAKTVSQTRPGRPGDVVQQQYAQARNYQVTIERVRNYARSLSAYETYQASVHGRVKSTAKLLARWSNPYGRALFAAGVIIEIVDQVVDPSWKKPGWERKTEFWCGGRGNGFSITGGTHNICPAPPHQIAQGARLLTKTNAAAEQQSVNWADPARNTVFENTYWAGWGTYAAYDWAQTQAVWQRRAPHDYSPDPPVWQETEVKEVVYPAPALDPLPQKRPVWLDPLTLTPEFVPLHHVINAPPAWNEIPLRGKNPWRDPGESSSADGWTWPTRPLPGWPEYPWPGPGPEAPPDSPGPVPKPPVIVDPDPPGQPDPGPGPGGDGSTVIVVGPDGVFAEGGPPTHEYKRPGPKEREQKRNGMNKTVARIARSLGPITEAIEATDCAFKSLPVTFKIKQLREWKASGRMTTNEKSSNDKDFGKFGDKSWGPRGGGPTPQMKAEAVVKWLSTKEAWIEGKPFMAYMDRLGACLVENHVEDMFWGKIGQATGRAAKKARRPYGYQSGPTL